MRGDEALPPLTGPLSAVNTALHRATILVACTSLAGLLVVVVYGVVMRYAFNHAPPYVEQVALLLIVSVAMFGASAGVREAGHIGLDSLVRRLPPRARSACVVVVHAFVIAFALSLLAGGFEMAMSTARSRIPTLGIPEAVRYLPVMAAGLLMALFSVEQLVALREGKEVTAPWR